MFKYNKNDKNFISKKGFTLMELLIVIVILGIILLIAGPSILNVYKKLAECEVKGLDNQKLINKLLDLAYSSNILVSSKVCLEWYTSIPSIIFSLTNLARSFFAFTIELFQKNGIIL